jgi:hypothetical protein
MSEKSPKVIVDVMAETSHPAGLAMEAARHLNASAANLSAVEE